MFSKAFRSFSMSKQIAYLAIFIALSVASNSELGVELSAENRKQLMIPRGFAHGFYVLSDTAEFCYKCDEFYHPEDEGGIIWNDPDIGIDWQLDGEPKLSEKDKKHPAFAEGKTEFDI